MPVALSRIVLQEAPRTIEVPTDSRDPSCWRLLDQDIAQVESLARLDGEFLAKLHPLFRVGPRRRVADPVQARRDQGRERDSALGIGRRILRVVDRVNLDQGTLIGEQETFLSAFRGRESAGVTTIVISLGWENPPSRLAIGADQPRLGGAAGLEPDGDRSAAADLPEIAAVVPSLASDRGSRPGPRRQVRAHAARTGRRARSVFLGQPHAPLSRGRPEDQPAEYPGVRNGCSSGPMTRPWTFTPRRSATRISWPSLSGFGSQAMKAWE